MKAFCVKIESKEQAARVIDIAVEMGATPNEGVKGYHTQEVYNTLWSPLSFKYVGVTKFGKTSFTDRRSIYGYNVITMKELEEMYEEFKQFKKSDLKAGKHLVTLRNGKEYLVLDGGILFMPYSEANHWVELNHDEDMKCSYYPECDIMKVWTFHRICGFSLAPEYKQYRTLVWERKEEIEELTLEQVCKELGREIKLKPNL